MALLDPATGRPLPASDDSYQRVLFVTNNVHVYGIPPLTSTRGFSASSWTHPSNPTAQQIFTSRLRVIETTVNGKIKVDIVLEDGNTGELFAAAPYSTPAVVQQANDSSRFFAVRVQGEGGMKATLGIGFEDRSPAFDFSIALTEARKVLGLEGGTAGNVATGRGAAAASKADIDVKRDFSLKEGEKIHIQVGSKGRRAAPPASSNSTAGNESAALFSIAPPPPAGKFQPAAASIAPPSAVDNKSAQDFGFDDGEFGEFQ